MIIITIIVIITIKGLYYKMETIFINTENSKSSELHKFRLNLTDKLNLKNPKQKHSFSQFKYQARMQQQQI